MSTRRRRMDRLEQHHAAASLERMTIEELINELVQIEMSAKAPLLSLLLPAAGPPRGMTPVEHRTELDRAFRERDGEAMHQLVDCALRSGDWSAFCTAAEGIMLATADARVVS